MMSENNGSDYLPQLQAEKDKIDESFVHAGRLLQKEIEKVQTGGAERGEKLVELHHDKPQKFTKKVMIPVKEFPRVNFVGKLLGPKGMSLKRLQEETGCKMAVLGRNSMRDKKKEEELRQQGGKYAHLNEELHLQMEVFAMPGDAFTRMAHACEALKKFLVPEFGDEIREQQMAEMGYMDNGQGVGMPRGRGRGAGMGMPPGRGRATPLLSSPPGRGAPSRGAPRGAMRGLRGRGAPRGGHADALLERPSYEQDYGTGRGAVGYGSGRGSGGGGYGVGGGGGGYGSAGYDDSYGQESYEESYDQSGGYGSGAGDTQYFDYGHGGSSNSREEYGGGQSWGGANSSYGKSLGMKSNVRAHPYGGAAPRGGRY